MNLADHIKAEHDEFRAMLERLVVTHGNEVDIRKDTSHTLIRRSIAHRKAEEATVFGSLVSRNDTRGLALQMLEQHKAVAAVITDLRTIPFDDEVWLPKLIVLKFIFEAHLTEEEIKVLAHVEDFFGGAEVNRMFEEFQTIEKGELEKRK